MRDIRQGNCPKCDYHEIVQALPVTVDPLQQLRRISVAPYASVGALNIFICRRCGYSEWYAASPDQIPIGENSSNRLIRGTEPAGPYR